jgi:hypothetical protein
MRLLVLLFLISFQSLSSQSYDHNWLLGYPPNDSINKYGGTALVFDHPINPTVKYYKTPAPLGSSVSISGEDGKVLFFSNGCGIFNGDYELMENGDSLNPGKIFDWYCDEDIYPMGQGMVALPVPGDSLAFYLFSLACEADPLYEYLRVSKINFNGFEKGIVEYKNQIILNDTISDNFTAVKHANGRDWWLILQKYILGGNSNEYLTFLITPERIQGPFSQKVGKWWNDLTFTGQAAFSADGSKYAVMNPNNGLYLYDFDRCSGKLSNANHITFPGDTILSSGVAFSENSRFLYVSTTLNVYQFDMASPNIATSKTLVARYDGFFSGGFSTYFYQAMRGPNGKIYISAPNSVQHLHVIHNPNGKGADCDLRQHGLRLKSYIDWFTPNFPNYRLGALPDSPCDSLSGVVQDPRIDTEEFVLYPNPSYGQISFKSLNQLNFDDYLLRVFTVSGLKIFESTLQKSLDFSQQPNGMYIYKITDKKGRLVQAGKFAINS